MSVFQRTGNWFLPRKNLHYPPALRALLPTRPRRACAARRCGLKGHPESLTALIRHPSTVGRLGKLRSTQFMRRQLRDPEVRRKAWPDYTFGCKRILFSSHCLPALAAQTTSSSSPTAITRDRARRRPHLRRTSPPDGRA